jgi:hypothetical protein
MYRCHFTCKGRIVAGADLSASALEQAIHEAQTMLAEGTRAGAIDGFEIWQGAYLLHAAEELQSPLGAGISLQRSDPSVRFPA